jgi:hypothetical protein
MVGSSGKSREKYEDLLSTTLLVFVPHPCTPIRRVKSWWLAAVVCHNQLTTAAAKAALRDFPKMSRKQIGNDDQSEGLRNFAKSDRIESGIASRDLRSFLSLMRSARTSTCVIGICSTTAIDGRTAQREKIRYHHFQLHQYQFPRFTYLITN